MTNILDLDLEETGAHLIIQSVELLIVEKRQFQVSLLFNIRQYPLKLDP